MSAFPGPVRDALGEALDYCLLAPGYPRGWRTGTEFVRRRVEVYHRHGLRGVVVDYSPANTGEPRLEPDDAAPVLAVPPGHLADVLAAVPAGLPLLAHSPTPALLDLLREHAPRERTALWFHGYEVRDYRRLHCNTTTEELLAIQHIRDAQNSERFRAAAPVFADPALAKVFVSETQRAYSEADVGKQASNALVIPNLIDAETYRFRQRQPGEARRILLLRSFAQRNYAGDVALRALEICSRRDGFADLHITVRGFGQHFRGEVRPLRSFENVDVQEGHSSPAQMAALHDAHGIALVPTRYDTQGVMLGEAMASGMVTVTNAVAAIPEFTDETCSALARPDDPWAFADALWHLVTHPELVPEMSRRAGERVRQQCGPEATTDQEIELIRRLAA